MKQSTITYNKDNLTITIEGRDEVAKALDDLKKKTPAAAKVAINAYMTISHSSAEEMDVPHLVQGMLQLAFLSNGMMPKRPY